MENDSTRRATDSTRPASVIAKIVPIPDTFYAIKQEVAPLLANENMLACIAFFIYSCTFAAFGFFMFYYSSSNSTESIVTVAALGGDWTCIMISKYTDLVGGISATPMFLTSFPVPVATTTGVLSSVSWDAAYVECLPDSSIKAKFTYNQAYFQKYDDCKSALALDVEVRSPNVSIQMGFGWFTASFTDMISSRGNVQVFQSTKEYQCWAWVESRLVPEDTRYGIYDAYISGAYSGYFSSCPLIPTIACFCYDMLGGGSRCYTGRIPAPIDDMVFQKGVIGSIVSATDRHVPQLKQDVIENACKPFIDLPPYSCTRPVVRPVLERLALSVSNSGIVLSTFTLVTSAGLYMLKRNRRLDFIERTDHNK